jgi:sialate O-acetylesterase
MKRHLTKLLTLAGAVAFASGVQAEVSLPNIFGDHMVLQRGQQNPVWGWADKGEKVTVTIGDQSHSATANDKGEWRVKLAPMKVGKPLTLTVKGRNTFKFTDVLVGEVWICSGQSNMAWSVGQADDADLEVMTAKQPNIRIISVPQVGTQEAQDNFKGKWERCSPQNIGSFSAVGYFFGRQLHQTLDIPIGLIDNAWGGSAAEAWIRRDVLEADKRYAELLDRWKQTEKTYDHKKAVEAWKARVKKWEEGGKKGGKPRAPRDPLTGNHRPANIYNGVLHPTIGYGIRGAIWYQGESNAGRAYQYRHLFPLMIQHWRDEWKQGDFPFYFVQLADFHGEVEQPGGSSWAELREAQTMTLSKLKNTGQAVIIDIGEGRDIHPRNKQIVGKRLARWALAKDYGIDVVHQSPTYKSMEVKGGKATLAFDHVGKGLYSFDVVNPVGFAIAGKDQKFVWAEARIIGKDKVQVWSDKVKEPVAVRYGWAENPVVTLYSRDGLPATPFRTDDWPGVTINSHK